MNNGVIRLFLVLVMFAVIATSASTTVAAAQEPITLEFIQWWEPELPAGEFRALMDEFEAQNPGIRVELISGPYASTKEQVIAGAVAGTMSDVVGLDGAWVSDFVQQGSIANLSELMAEAGYDDSELASQIQLNGSTYMIPVVNFVYPVFVNLDLMEKAGITTPPATRTEFADAAAKMTDEANNVYGWVLPLSMEQPNGIQNDVMSWVWASGGSMMKDGQPDLTNADVRSGMEYIKGLYDAGVIAPGSFSMKEQDKVEEFTNGRVGMMVDSLAHINLIRENNPELNFAITALPAADDYSGKRGLPYASWGIGISANTEHPAEAWKLVQYLMSQETNSKLSSIANAFPGNINATPDFVQTDELFAAAFEVFKAGYLANEFVGLPVAEDLMRLFDEQFQLYLDGSQSLDDTLTAAQDAWMQNFPAAEAAGEPVTLEFIQWWEPELPAGEFRALMDEFEAQNPGIRVELISGPYASTKEQVIAGAVAGTMSDVVGLDGAWVSDFVQQGSIANLSELMAEAGYDDSELASQIQLNGSTYMIPVVNFVYPVFVNLDLMEKAGITTPPATRTEFADAAAKMTDEANNVYGWVLPLSMEQPNGIQNDVMSWVWASGGSMMKDGQPDLTNADVRSGMEYIKGLYDAGVIAPGSFSMKEQDKVEEFTNGRVGMMVDSLAHINLIRENNPELNFAITALPAADDYSGKRGLPYASWGIGISANTEHPAEAWKLVQYLMSQETNSKLSSIANAFPGNINATPDFVQTDELFAAAFEVFKAGYLANEFVGLPVAEDLMRLFDEQFQLYLDGSQSLDDTLTAAQDAWMQNFPAAEAAGEPVTLEFIQWWEPELPAGEFRALMDEFEAQNPGIRVELISGPYASTKEQVIAGAVAGTMSDVVGLDGAWVSDFVQQGSIANLSELMAEAGYDDSELASQIQLNGSTYMIPVVNFVYPVFVNLDLMEKAGITTPPATRTEFADAAAKMTDEANNVYGWVLPLSMEQPNGIQNDVMSWVWASGGSMMKDGQPDLTNADVRSGMEYIKGLYDAGVIAPGSFSMKEQDKVEEFTNGRVGMMVDSLAHINLIRENNPELNFAITALPAADDYSGKRGLPYASWGIGISANTEHPAEAWKLVQYLMSQETNSKLSSIANAFPGNINATPDFVQTDELFAAAFEVFKAGYLANEFVGLPVAEDLMRLFDEQFQLYLDGSQSLDDTLTAAQDAWMQNFPE